jgi:nicotinate-nucleotide adenylyltransferase
VATSRVGWLGGSFDPVHEGHLAIAQVAADRFGLQRVLLVPARLPPHKLDKRLASGEDRLALLSLACEVDSRLEPCDVELSRDGPSYSYDTATELLASLPDDTELLYVIGADTLADLPTWHRIAELARLVTFCAVTRTGTPLDTSTLVEPLGAESVAAIDAHLVTMEPHPASSTAVRAALTAGHEPEHVPAAVLAEIRRRGLYSSQDGGAASSDTSGSKRV